MGVAVADLRGTHAIACLTRLLVDVARPSRGFRPKRVTSGQLRRSATPCKNLQGLPGNASSIGHERLRCGTADHDNPESAAICRDLVEPQELVAARSWRFESALPSPCHPLAPPKLAERRREGCPAEATGGRYLAGPLRRRTTANAAQGRPFPAVPVPVRGPPDVGDAGARGRAGDRLLTSGEPPGPCARHLQ